MKVDTILLFFSLLAAALCCLSGFVSYDRDIAKKEEDDNKWVIPWMIWYPGQSESQLKFA